MRFARLELERYGPFTGRFLPFRDGAKLHVVYGPNEAGKSTALAAVSDLLFGFEHRTAFDFLHAGPDLRLGGTLIGRDGAWLAFRRRKGRGNTLIGADDTALPEDLLAPYLGGIGRAIFGRAFGLSTASLREGAQEMLKADGDIGATLFAAASGLHEPSELRRALNQEADAIYVSRGGKNRIFNQALERFETARKTIREQELRGADWKALNARIEELKTKLDEVDGRRAEVASAEARLARLKRLAPLTRLLDEALAELGETDEAADRTQEFAERLRLALAAAVKAQEQAAAARQALALTQEEHDGLVVDESLVSHAGEIAMLSRESGKYVAAKEDLPGVDREAEALRRQMEGLARRLGLAGAEELDRRAPTAADLALLRRLLADGRALQGETMALAAEEARERRGEAALGRELAGHGPTAADPEPLRERLAALEPALRRQEQRVEMARELRIEERRLAEAAQRLDPPVASLDTLAAAPLPAAETISRFRRGFDDLGKRLDRAGADVEAAARTCRDIEAELDKLAAGRPVPSAEAIAAERQERDATWEQLRAVLFGAELAPQERSAATAAFERHKGEADRLADEALGDAGRVAEHALRREALATERERQREAEAKLAKVRQQMTELTAEWEKAFVASGVKPHPPAEMAAWSAALAHLIERRALLLARRDTMATLEQGESGLAAGLAAVAQSAGLDQIEGVAPDALAARLEAHLRRMAEARERLRGISAKLAASRERIAECEAQLQDARTRQAEWQVRWQAALPRLGLAPGAALDEVEAALQTWTEVPQAAETLAREDRRIAGMHRDNAEFEERVTDILRATAPDLADTPAHFAIQTLQERSVKASQIAALRKDCGTRLAKAAEADRRSAEIMTKAQAALAALAAETGLADAAGLPDLAARIEKRATLREMIGDRRQHMLRAADGLDEAKIRTELADFDAATVEPKLLELGREAENLDRDAKEIFAEHDREKRRREALESGHGAELAAQHKRNAEGELASAAREWAVLKLGALLIGTAIDRHRAQARHPLMSRAQELFGQLTGQAFAGLGSRYDEEDRPVLTARRASGAELTIEGLSEGTRDQLYLALRLAYVESYAQRHEPLPFIADDIFVTFDDDRTAHGIATLAGIGASVQPILFTHHRRIVEIAVERLGEEADVVEMTAGGLG